MSKQLDICFNRHKGNEESTEAFNNTDTNRRRALVFACIKHSGSLGITVDEACQVLGVPPNAISGRFSELKKMKKIIKVGTRPTRTGCSAGIYIAINVF